VTVRCPQMAGERPVFSFDGKRGRTGPGIRERVPACGARQSRSRASPPKPSQGPTPTARPRDLNGGGRSWGPWALCLPRWGRRRRSVNLGPMGSAIGGAADPSMPAPRKIVFARRAGSKTLYWLRRCWAPGQGGPSASNPPEAKHVSQPRLAIRPDRGRGAALLAAGRAGFIPTATYPIPSTRFTAIPPACHADDRRDHEKTGAGLRARTGPPSASKQQAIPEPIEKRELTERPILRAPLGRHFPPQGPMPWSSSIPPSTLHNALTGKAPAAAESPLYKHALRQVISRRGRC